LAQWFLRRSRLKEKLTDDDDPDADDGRIVMAIAHLSPGELISNKYRYQAVKQKEQSNLGIQKTRL